MAHDIEQLAVTLVKESCRAGCNIRLLGSVAVIERCQAGLARAPELSRSANDIDLVGLSDERTEIQKHFESHGLLPHREFNVLSGGERLLYTIKTQQGGQVRVDVMLDRLAMCHILELASRLDRHPLTISATDLLLSKLQVVFPSERDAKDILALITTFSLRPIAEERDYLELDYLCQLCGSNWGWHHTVMLNLNRVEGWLDLMWNDDIKAVVRERTRAIEEALLGCPKTLRWRWRNVIGERLRWYQIPEELVPE